MKLQDWERDILNRQRNIVFPDTVLNTFRLYRHIIRFKVKLNPVQRAGVFVIGTMSVTLGFSFVADSLYSLHNPVEWLAVAVAIARTALWVALGYLLLLRALTAESAPKAPRWWIRQRARRRV